jgi:hypothetical protein
VRNGLVINDVSLYGQMVVSGALVVVAVAVDRLITGRGERQARFRDEAAYRLRRLRRTARPLTREGRR